ncbi:MAG: methionyl aminopeptidase [Acidobacteria bacterium]|nr:methionyl aminopeptidase [Acidobacteriota bacterium]MCB9398584.1 methionyl aminopeptidase [Acidobacteriota bacterium]
MQRSVKLGRNDPCWCGSGKKLKKCHPNEIPANPLFRRQFQILEEADMPKMRRVCRLNAEILAEVCKRVVPGVSTEQINTWVHEMTLDAGAYPAPLNYPKGLTDPRNPQIKAGGFPKSVCTSVNEIVCHGIPSADVILKDGDIVNVDVTCLLDGFFGDSSATVYVGTPSDEAKLVTETARECLEAGIRAVQPGGRLIAVGQAISQLAGSRGLGVVREYTGHGIGRVFHTEPQVCHYPNPETDCELVPGMTFTIEPMINAGTWRTELDNRDKWTVYTADRRLSAQFEHTVRVTETGVEVLTQL